MAQWNAELTDGAGQELAVASAQSPACLTLQNTRAIASIIAQSIGGTSDSSFARPNAEANSLASCDASDAGCVIVAKYSVDSRIRCHVATCGDREELKIRVSNLPLSEAPLPCGR